MIRALTFAVAVLAHAGRAGAALTTQPLGAVTPTDLVNALLGPGVTASNITFTGDPQAAGSFAGGTGIIGFAGGIVLSSGAIADVPGPNASDGTTTDHGLAGDLHLNGLVTPLPTYDAAVLEFDFVPCASEVTFDYVFSSEEYNEYANSSVNDVFGFFLNGINVARLPGSTVYISINTVNGGNPYGFDAQNPAYFINNDTSDGGGAINTEMDGLTVVLQVKAAVTPGASNHIKLAIADTGDGILDSNVFLRAGSFTVSGPAVSINKSAPADVFVGDPLTYRIVVGNIGATTVAQIAVWDSIPANAAFVSASDGGSLAGTLVTWPPLALLPGETATLYLTVTVTAGPLGANTAEGNFSTTACGAPVAQPLVSSPVPVVVLRAQPVLTKSVDTGPFVPAGGELTYRIAWENIGAGTGTGVTFTDALGAGQAWDASGLSFWAQDDPLGTPALVDTAFAADPAGPWTAGEPPGGTAGPLYLRWIVDRMAPARSGWITYRVVASATLADGDLLGNAVSATVALDPAAYVAAPVTVTVTAPVVTLVKSADPAVVPEGGVTTWRIVWANTGGDTATGVVLTDTVPAGADLVTVPAGGVVTGTLVSWTPGDLPPGATGEVTFTTTIPGAICPVGPNRALATFTGSPGNARPEAQSNPVFVQCIQPQLELFKDPSRNPAPAGSDLVFTLTVTNTGTDTAFAVTVWDSLPPGSVYRGCAGGLTCGWDGVRVAWSVPDLPPGGVVVLTVTVTADPGAGCPNVAEAAYANGAGLARPNVPSNAVCVPVVNPAVGFAVTPDRLLWSAGEPVAYTLLIWNQGTDTAISMSLADSWAPLIGSAALWSATPAGTPGPGGAGWVLPELPPGASVTVWVSVLPAAPGCAGGTLDDWAFLRHENSAGVAQPDLITAAATVSILEGEVASWISPPAPVAQRGATVVFTLSWSNPCSETAWAPVLRVALPPGLGFGSAAGGGAPDGGGIAWVLPDLPPGRSGSVAFTVTATGPGPAQAPVAPSATFQSGSGYPQAASGASATVWVLEPRLTLVKRGPAEAVARDRFAYTIVVTNAGDDTAFNVVIADTLPPPLGFVSATPAASRAGALVWWSITRLGVGESVTAGLVVLSAQPDADSAPVNVAQAGYRSALGVAGVTPPSGWTVQLTPTLVIRVFPQPFDPAVSPLKITGLARGARVRIFTLAGREVVALESGPGFRAVWDGRAADGAPCAAGVYLWLVEPPPGVEMEPRPRGKFGMIR